MTNGSHQHTCIYCEQPFYCRILVECFMEPAYAVCDKPACIMKWESPKPEDYDGGLD